MQSYQPVRPLPGVAPYQGGKRHLARVIVERIEAIPHQVYAEPFTGMGGVFLRRRLRPRLEVINDLGRDVANLYRVIQRHPEALYEQLRWALNEREAFERLERTDPDTLTDVERAARFYFLQRLAYGGKIRSRSFGVSLGESRFDAGEHRDRLALVHQRLAGVVIERLPYADLLTRYDSAGTLFYLDPPYWGSEDAYGPGLWPRSEFARLAAQLRGLAGRFLLSLNDVPEVRTAFAGFHLEELRHTFTVSNAHGAAAEAAELLISDGPRPGDLGQGILL